MTLHIGQARLSSPSSSSLNQTEMFDMPRVSSYSTAAVITGDTAALKARLAAIVDEVQSTNPKEAYKSLKELCTFFDGVAEQNGIHVQHIFGQHVTNNTLFVVMNSVVKPALTQYCNTMEKRRHFAARHAWRRGRVSCSAPRRRINSDLTSITGSLSSSTAAVVAEEELDVFNSNRAKQLRADVVRPWRTLVETIHHGLPASLLTAKSSQHFSSHSLLLFPASAGVAAINEDDLHTTASCRAYAFTAGETTATSSSEAQCFLTTAGGGVAGAAGSRGGGETTLMGRNFSEGLWAAPPNHTLLPLLWKNAVPLFSITRHAMDVLNSDVLVAACGQEYAQLLLHIFLFDGYISNLQPSFIVELTMRLLQLLEATVYDSSDTIKTTATTSTTAENLLKEHGDICDVAEHEIDSYSPSVEEGTTYAALLVQLFRSPHLINAFAACEDSVAPAPPPSEPTASGVTVPFVIQRLVCLATRRHLRPTSALRLEAHLLLALNLLVSVARDDYPLASATPLELIKPLCHLFYTTVRRDGWRMEAFSFMTTQVCTCFSVVLGHSVRKDIERSRLINIVTQQAGCDVSGVRDDDNKEENVTMTGSSLSIAPRNLTLLHETLFPFTLNFFTVARSEFSFVSRRELFHFPCTPLAPFFDFGVVVLYLACCTYEAYMALPSSSSLFSFASDTGGVGNDSGNNKTRPQSISSPDSHVDLQPKKDLKNRKRLRENGGFYDKMTETMETRAHTIQTEPADAVLSLFRSFFFFDSVRDTTRTTSIEAKSETETNIVTVPTKTTTTTAAIASKDMPDSVNEQRGTNAEASNLLRVGVTVGGALSAVAVQDLVKDGSLFMMHILAQPGATFGFSERQCTLLIEHAILPLFPYYGIKLESILLAVLQAVAPRATVQCQHNVFCWLVRRYMATVATQRDDESQPKEQVYRLLSVLLERCVVGLRQLLIHSEEHNRLQAAAHFCALNARFNALFFGTLGGGFPSSFTNALPLTIKSSVNAVCIGQNAKAGVSNTLFLEMLRFLSLYQHYCATSADTIMAHRAAGKRQPRKSGCGGGGNSDKTVLSSKEKENELTNVASAAVHFPTGLNFVICGISHAVCFYSHDDGLFGGVSADTTAAAAASSSAAVFLQALRYVEDYIVSVSFSATEAELGCRSSLAAGSGFAGAANKTTFLPSPGSGKTAASLQRMKLLLVRSRNFIEAAFLFPQKHVPMAVCNAAEGHWLLLNNFFTSPSSQFTVRKTTEAILTASLFSDGDGCGDNRDNDDLKIHTGRLRRGDVPFCVLETLAVQVARVVEDLAERVKITANVTGGSCLQQKSQGQQQREMDEETMAATQRMICIHSVQLLHLLLRLFRLGIWQLPQKSQCSYNETGEGGFYDSKNKKDKDVDEDDLYVLSNIQQAQMFDNPISVFCRLSWNGQLYYAVIWLCHHLATRLLRSVFVCERIVLWALLVLFNDVGTVLLSQSFALWEPRQVVLSFVGVVCRRALEEGIAKILPWPSTGANSAEATDSAQMTTRLSCSILGVIFRIVRQTRVLTASNDPLVSPMRVTSVLVSILEKEGLIPSKDSLGGTSIVGDHLNIVGGSTDSQSVLKLNPFPPSSLSVIDGIIGLLRTLHIICGDAQARLALRQLLETLFARYRYGLAESVFLTFAYYDSLHYASPSSLAANDSENESNDYNTEEDKEEKEKGKNGNCTLDGCKIIRDDDFRRAHTMRDSTTCGRAAKMQKNGLVNKKLLNDNVVLMLEEGKLLEIFVNQLTDMSRSDMPVVAPRLQCALLSGIYGMLFCCDATVAEKLGKYLFSFLSTKTAYVVRRHTALHVRWLFNRFSHRAYLVLHELLYRAREGIASISSMHCATSMRALGEAAVAVPMMEADIICTLLECWATRGFAHKALVIECLELIAGHTRVADKGVTNGAFTATTDMDRGWGSEMSAQQLCHYHRERLLLDWLWRLDHRIEAFPIACFGYTKPQQMWKEFMPTLLPLALLCSARRGGNAEKEDEVGEASVFFQPNDFLWRLVECYQHGVVPSSLKSECRKEMLMECLVGNFPDVMARLFVFAALRRRCWENDTRKQQILSLHQDDIANAASVALEWVRTTLSSKYIYFLHRYADAILCRFVDLAGVMAPLVRLRDLHKAASMLCERLSTLNMSENFCSSPLCAMSSLDMFFESDAGDHAYVLLQHLYAVLTHYVYRGSRRFALALLFKHIVKRWWRRDLLQRLPHVLHTVLRLCGNILMTCVDVRSQVCDVLLYVWTVVTSPPSPSSSSASPSLSSSPSLMSFDRLVAADKVFISTIMLGLVEESHVVAVTWAAICRADKLLQRRDWQFQHARFTLESFAREEESGKAEKHETIKGVKEVVVVDDDSDEQEEKDEDLKNGEENKKLQQEKNLNSNSDSNESLCNIKDSIQSVEGILPLLQSTVLIAGAPASSFYSDVASAVDRNRVAFVTIIRMYTQEQEGQDISLDIYAASKEKTFLSALQRIYETCCRVVQHLLALVCMDDTFDMAGRVIIKPHIFGAATTAETTAAAFMITERTTKSAATLSMPNLALAVLQGTNYELQLGAFRLLRSLCWCFIEAGAESHVDALFYFTGAIQEMLQSLPFDDVLHRIYRQHAEQLYRFSFDADAYVAHIASTTLRGWICGSKADDYDSGEIEDFGNLASEREINSESRVDMSKNSGVGIRSGVGDDGSLIKRALALFRTEESKMTESVNSKRDNTNDNNKNSSVEEEEYFNLPATVRLEDINAFCRRLLGVSAFAGVTYADGIASNIVSLLSDTVWEALSVHEDESRFLRLFLVAIIRHYNLHQRFCTLATILNCMLLQPLVDKSSSILLFMESFLPVVFIHVMLVKESETQRAQRLVWSQLLEQHLFCQPLYFRRTARLFLRAIHVCHSVLITVVRSYGVRPEGVGSQSFARMSLSDIEIAEESLPFPFFVNSNYGNLPLLSDMRESYWLSDIDPLILASAAVGCYEPHLALFFAEISGESLLGRRKGIPSAAMAVVGRPKFSVLFPLIQGKALDEGHNQLADGRRGGRLLRSDEAQAEMTRLLLTYSASVQAIRVDAEALLHFHDCGSGGNSDERGTGTRAFCALSALPSSTDSGHNAYGYTTSLEESFFMHHPIRFLEREKNRGNWHTVLSLLDRLDDAEASVNYTFASGSSADDGPKCNSNSFKLSRCKRLVERANALMHLGAFDTALQILAPALKRGVSSSILSVASNSQEQAEEEDEEKERAQLRAAFASALWRLGRWDVAFLEDEQQQEFFNYQRGLFLPSLVSVDEAIFFALRSAHRGEHHDVRRWTSQAQLQLASRIDATNWFCTMLQAEVLRNIEETSERFIRCSSFSSLSSFSITLQCGQQVSPSWVNASLKYVHAPYRELELMDSVHQKLCVVYRQPQWWLDHLNHSSERALRGNRPLVVHRWLSAYAEMSESLGTCSDDSTLKNCPTRCNTTIPLGLPIKAFLALLQARAEFVSGNLHRAIAILQNIETSPLKSSFQREGLIFPMPENAVKMPVIVQQLVVWAKEARLVPLSQLVRDPYLLTSVKNDTTGVCCLQLARLCHTLVRDIATRLQSEEYRKLRSSIEASNHTRAELEQRQQQQQAAGFLSEAENKILRHRIRILAAEALQEEDEWHREAEMYALYRRSALNAYARFLERSGSADSDDLFAVFAFVSLWLQQDEELGERHLRNASSALLATSGVIKRAMKGIPLHKFLPLFSQLVAQLGTSIDDKNLEKIVLSIAMEAPLHAIWPLLALTNGHNFGPKAGAVGGGVKGGLHLVDEKKVAIARRIICELKDVKENDDVFFCKDATLRQRIVCEAERLSAAYIQLAFYRVHNVSRPTHRIPQGFMIAEDEMRNLIIPPPTLKLSTFSFTSSVPLHVLLQYVPRVVQHEMTFTTPGGINLPKALKCVLSDGRIVRELLKSEDDLRQDSLIEQVFSLSNQLFAKEQRTRRLHVCTYTVVPLAPTVGIIEWVDDTIPLGQYINGNTNSFSGAEGKRRCRIGAHERYFPGELTTMDCRARLHAAKKTEKHTVLLELYAEFSPALHYFFLEQFFTPQEWLERRKAYTRTVATSSILGYIVGLGDRHGNNLLLHTRSAELVHIDLGFAFDQGRLLPVPELVPFRLTRNIVDGFGVQGVEGPFRYDCEGTLRVIRERKELLMTVLEACAHDPLARWAVTVFPLQETGEEAGGEKFESREFAEGATPPRRDFGVNRGRPTYADAERTLSHVAQKIQGHEAGELLSVPTHVHKLLQTAQNTELLAQMYVGWSPWL